MKRPSTPTLRQKQLIGSKRLNPQNWLVVVDKPDTLVIIHRHSDTTIRNIKKGGALCGNGTSMNL